MVEKLFTKKNLIIILFVVFLFLRFFTSSTYNFLDDDHDKYLSVARTFPYHQDVNGQLDVNHGPVFPYNIHLFSLVFQESYLATIFISLISAIVTFFILYKLILMLTNNFQITFITLLFFTLSVEFITASKIGLKESFAVMLIILTIYYYIKGIKFDNKTSVIAASIFGGLTALTVDQVIFLFPTFILSYIFFNYKKLSLKRLKFPGFKYAIIPIMVTLLLYASWIGIKFYQYSTNDYYSTSDGTLCSTKDFGILQVLNPRYFADYDPQLKGGFTPRIRDYAYGIGYMFDVFPFDIPRGVNFESMEYLLFPKHVVYMIVFYLPLALIAAFGFLHILKHFIKTKQIYNNTNLFMICVFLIFLFPLTQWRSSVRYFYTAFIFLYFIIGYGLFVLFKKWRINEKFPKLKLYSKPIVAVLLLLLIPIWCFNNPNFLLTNEPYFYAQYTADFINNNLEQDVGIMVQPGYVHKLEYLTDRRTIGLPPVRDNLLFFIDYYDIDYIITGRYIIRYKYFYSEDTVEYIDNHPEMFELIATIKEDYDSLSDVKLEFGGKMRSSDEIYIYKIHRKEAKKILENEEKNSKINPDLVTWIF